MNEPGPEDSAAGLDGPDSDDPESHGVRCDYCRHPIPAAPVEHEVEGDTYRFCSKACRDAMVENERVFTEYHGHRRIRTGVSGLDQGLPQGLPRNAFVLIAGQAGTRDSEVLAELAWRRLRQGEPVVYVTFQEPPEAVVQTFLTLDWNVLPYLEQEQLAFVDCFTYRMEDPELMHDRLSDWNRHLHEIARGATESVRDPSDMGEFTNKLDNRLGARDMVDRGAAIVDSLTELGTLVQPIQAYDVVKDLRADVCKGRFVPMFAGSTLRDTDAFPHDLAYAVDGLVDLELDGSIVEDVLIKRARIRKLSGVLAIPRWTAYEYTSGEGMVTFDPGEEMRKASGDGPTGETADDGNRQDDNDRPEEDDRPDDVGGGGQPAGDDDADGQNPDVVDDDRPA